ncbi:MAG: hypothetical protein LBJ72_05035 [Dysgonamonadaceae bacterium]|jgi:hypothetical protein|nr:hypothetical protein [Dysgonamonadaceae bacterium]
MKKRMLLPFCFFVLFNFFPKPYEIKADVRAEAEQVFEKLDQSGKYCEELNNSELQTLPVGLKQTIGNSEFTVAVSSIKFLETHAEFTVFARMKIPQKDKVLFFGAQNVKFSYEGSFIGDAYLVLLDDFKIPISGSMELILKGGMDATTGRAPESESGMNNLTYVKIECVGFKELSVCGEITFSDKMIEQVSSNGKPTGKPVTSSFRTVVQDWNDLLVEISLPRFAIKGLNGFIFDIKSASLDLSDFKNPSAIRFPSKYEGVDKTSPGLWRGAYFREVKITLPEAFSFDKGRISFDANDMLIDDRGISGKFTATNILPVDIGNASGWAFSIDDFLMELESNTITAAGFKGLIGLPVSKKQALLNYEAIIAENDHYSMSVALKDSLKFDFLAAKAVLKKNSSVILEIKDEKFLPEARLSGYLDINADPKDPMSSTEPEKEDTTGNSNLKNIEFTNLILKTVDPYIQVKSMGYSGEINLFGFPVSISDVKLTAPSKNVVLGFNLSLNLDKQFIHASSRLEIKAKYITNENRHYWEYEKTDISGVKIDCTIANAVSLSGELAIMKKDPEYGDGFKGNLDMTFKKPLAGLHIKSSAIFGKKEEHRYWYVDGLAEFPQGVAIPLGPLSINGFGGGLSSGMKKESGGSFTSSGCKYIPDPQMGIGLKSAILFNIGGKAMKGDAAFEIEFYKTGGVRYLGLFGSVLFMEDLEFSNIQSKLTGKLGKLMELEKKLSSAAGSSGESNKETDRANDPDIREASKDEIKNSAVAAHMGMYYNFEQQEFHANFEIYVSLAGGIVRGVNSDNLAGSGVLHIDPSTWYLHLGTPQRPIGLQVGIPSLATVESKSYFMTGNHMPDALPPPGHVADILGEHNIGINGNSRSGSLLSKGGGFAFGSALGIETGDLDFLILYAKFYAGMGFDIMLRDYGNMQCAGHSGSIGINGWYAQGQAYAYLGGEMGVKVNLKFIKLRIPILKTGVAALLQAQLPNPIWLRGDIGAKFNLLGGLVKGDMRFKFTLGEKCNLTYPGAPPIDMILIGDMTPVDGSQKSDVFTAPQLTLTLQENREFSLDDGGARYRVLLKEFAVYEGNTQLPATIEWNKSHDVATLIPYSVLPGEKSLKVKASVVVEEWENGAWKLLSGEEKRESSFTTGKRPETIPLHNILYAYPSPGQQYFYPDESSNGYIVLRQDQSYLFEGKGSFQSQINSEGSIVGSSGFSYDYSGKKISFGLPRVSRNSSFEFNLFILNENSGSTEGGKSKEVEIFNYDSENTVTQTVKEASDVVRSGDGKSILNYPFSSSAYSTFRHKVENSNRGGLPLFEVIGNDILVLYMKKAGIEPFEDLEIRGNQGTDPLIAVEAIPEDNYYRHTIYPRLYQNYPVNGQFTLSRQDEYGIPPFKAITVSDFGADYFQYAYALPFYYFLDFKEIQRIVIDNNIKGHILNDPTRGFPVLEQGAYTISLQYWLPGREGKGSSTEFNYRR